MASFLARLYRSITGVTCSEPPIFLDVPSSSFAYKDVGCIYRMGVTTGTSIGLYSPSDPVTREQMAAFLTRLYIKITS